MISISSLSLGAVRAFEAAARHQSMSRAGDELFVTHAAVSHQVRNLEEWIGVPLFRRQGRGVQLTTAGEQLFVRVSPLLSGIADACKTVKAASKGASLTVGCIPSVASRWLVPNLDRFSSEFPDVEIRVAYAHADEKLASSNLDVLITYGEDPSKEVITEPLFSRINKPVCSPHFMTKHGPFRSPEQLIASELLHDASRDGWREWAGAAGLTLNKELAGTTYQDFNLLATAIIAGHGIGLCPVNVFSEEIRRGDLIVASDIATNGDKGYVVMTRRNRPKTVTNFVHWFVATTQAIQAGAAGTGSQGTLTQAGHRKSGAK
ncbi:MAG: LysR substrate-binding domain-containing protein [Burkholderiales bacterium]|nr:LysR substrate-binding domain-containing protein [Burkholderiales bacterium]